MPPTAPAGLFWCGISGSRHPGGTWASPRLLFWRGPPVDATHEEKAARNARPALHQAVTDAGADTVLLKEEFVETLVERLAAARTVV